ncbi:Nonribosomal peptide synthetase 6 [Beauveria bassiana]|uniref:Nonribosomal peptide synthetase 6 n=1 Tax=Beauveria bassiana TaxID=176275 RepID=A0A2N6P050_BEABA|nr:Nonribosomal peptide synthetase 6 [Beauveria bassiana]
MDATSECVRAGQLQQTLALEVRPDITIPLQIALQLAWSAVLGCYTGSNDVSFNLLHVDDQAAHADDAFTCSTVRVHLARNDSAQLAMNKLSQTKGSIEDEPSDTLLALWATVNRKHAQPKSVRHAYSQYQLSIECLLTDNPVALRAIYKDATWSSATIYFMLHQLRHAIHLLMTTSSVPVSGLQTISAEGRRQLMDWDTASLRQPHLETVWATIEKRCREQPTSMAIESWDGRLNYAELEQRVSAVAEKLSQLKVLPGTFVGLLLEKSVLSAVVILGVIKAGCAFVLLDVLQPSSRLKAMCTMTNVAMVVASPKNMKAGLSLRTICQSTDEFPLVPSGEISHGTPEPSSPLYAGFTSGSTGEPKGFVIQHDNFMSGLDEYCSGLDLKPNSRVFQFASYSFVVSITGQLAPLARGACLCIPSQFQLEHDIAGAIRDLRADWIAITPSAARIMDPGTVSSLKTLVMVGEEMSSPDLSKWSHLNLYSLYGQSENSKGTMIAKKTGIDAAAGIGRPYHANAWIVDPENHNVLLPIGAEGELVIESPCLTKGYINNECQTEASFVTNLEWVKSVGRGADVCIFKTGDLAKRNAADGSFQLLGRKGTRIKIRGQRVESGEVEHHIRRLLPIAKNVVVDILCTAEDALEQSPMLVAFISTSEASTSDADAPLLATPTLAFRKQSSLLDACLKDVLPSFMVPTAYVELAALPKTSTGKLDRRRLREAAGALTRRELIAYSIQRTVHREPRSGRETIIRDLCAEILQLPSDEVGMNDTFIDLGGDSIMARHLTASAKTSGISVELRELFRPATLAQIAQSGCSKKNCETPNVAGSPVDFVAAREDFVSRLPELFRQQDIEDVFPTLETQAAYASNRVVDCFPLHISGTVDVMRLQHACQALVARHAILRTVFHMSRKMLVQVVLRELPVPLLRQECDSWSAAVRWADEYGSQELKKRCNIGKPIIGFVLVTVPSEARQILVLRLSHGQYDGLCLRPLIQDLWQAYRGVPLVVRAEFKAHVLECHRRRTVKAYNIWRDVLQGSQPPSLFLRVPPADDEATISQTTRQLPKIRPLAGVTPASMVKAAWFEALRYETKQDDAVFGQLLHAWSGIDGVIGPCINVIPVRVRQSQGLTRRQIVQAIQLQHAETASANTLGWSDIVSNCTDWPAATEVDSVVLHQNWDRDIEVVSDGIICKKEMPMLSDWAVYPMLLVTHPRGSRLHALLLMSSRYRGLRDPVNMLNNFARALELLESHPDEMLDSKGL